LIPGRGTDESKTNDVTNRIVPGQVGILVELGRPSVGCRFRDVVSLVRLLEQLGGRLIEENPIFEWIQPGDVPISQELACQRILSAVVEIRIDREELRCVLEALTEFSESVNTVFTVGVVSRFDENGGLSVLDDLYSAGIEPLAQTKVNLGLGSPLREGESQG
jgi:hypothetical protein